MGKIVCEVCGTSYSDAAAQCPICGYVSLVGADVSAVANHETEPVQLKYEHVKGGRFSKANVKKRNKLKSAATPEMKEQLMNASEQKKHAPRTKDKAKKEENKSDETKANSNKGLVITVLILLLAIIAVIGYIAVTFVLPVVMPQKSEPEPDVTPTSTVEPTVVQEIVCTDISIDQTELILDAVGETAQISAVPVPVNTTEKLAFISGDTTVATVDANGLVTAVGAGYTKITVSCGDISIDCAITVNDDLAEFFFDQNEVVLEAIGDECQIYSGAVIATDINWSSDDELVATIHDGIVVAVGSGSTTVYGEYGGMVISCNVTCTAVEETEPTEPTQDMAAIEANGPYRLHNPYGVSDTDASIKVGDSFTLYLLDKNDEKVSDVEWSVENGSSCKVVDGKVTGIATGNSDVVATYGGKTYTCIVRVS